MLQHDPGGLRRPAWPEGSVVRARFSACQRYRYALSEIWDPSRPRVMFLLMNPSVAGPAHADPTLIRCGNFARAWGYGGQLIGNVHAYRVTRSAALAAAEDPVGPGNDRALRQMARQAETIVLAYGLPPNALRERAATVVAMLARHAPLQVLRLTRDGTPMHPLYLPASLKPQPYQPET